MKENRKNQPGRVGRQRTEALNWRDQVEELTEIMAYILLTAVHARRKKKKELDGWLGNKQVTINFYHERYMGFSLPMHHLRVTNMVTNRICLL